MELILVLALCGLFIYECFEKPLSNSTNKVQVEEKIGNRKVIIRNVKGTQVIIR
jgi:hypothetical protein